MENVWSYLVERSPPERSSTWPNLFTELVTPVLSESFPAIASDLTTLLHRMQQRSFSTRTSYRANLPHNWQLRETQKETGPVLSEPHCRTDSQSATSSQTAVGDSVPVSDVEVRICGELRHNLFQLSRRQTTIMTYHQDLKKKHTYFLKLTDLTATLPLKISFFGRWFILFWDPATFQRRTGYSGFSGLVRENRQKWIVFHKGIKPQNAVEDMTIPYIIKSKNVYFLPPQIVEVCVFIIIFPTFSP